MLSYIAPKDSKASERLRSLSLTLSLPCVIAFLVGLNEIGDDS